MFPHGRSGVIRDYGSQKMPNSIEKVYLLFQFLLCLLLLTHLRWRFLVFDLMREHDGASCDVNNIFLNQFLFGKLFWRLFSHLCFVFLFTFKTSKLSIRRYLHQKLNWSCFAKSVSTSEVGAEAPPSVKDVNKDFFESVCALWASVDLNNAR